MDRTKTDFGVHRQPRRLLRFWRPAGRMYGFHPAAYAALGLILLFIIAAPGCSRDKRQVENVALQFVEGMKNGDADTFEKIMDWDRWYSVQSSGTAAGTAKQGSSDDRQRPDSQNRKSVKGLAQGGRESEDFKKQKDMLLAVLSSDRVLKLRYLTADHDIKRVTVDGPEAVAQVNQKDRATGERRLITLWLHKDPDGVWKIYKFLSEDLKRT
jgi:hypothetical protein